MKPLLLLMLLWRGGFCGSPSVQIGTFFSPSAWQLMLLLLAPKPFDSDKCCRPNSFIFSPSAGWNGLWFLHKMTERTLEACGCRAARWWFIHNQISKYSFSFWAIVGFAFYNESKTGCGEKNLFELSRPLRLWGWHIFSLSLSLSLSLFFSFPLFFIFFFCIIIYLFILLYIFLNKVFYKTHFKVVNIFEVRHGYRFIIFIWHDLLVCQVSFWPLSKACPNNSISFYIWDKMTQTMIINIKHTLTIGSYSNIMALTGSEC